MVRGFSCAWSSGCGRCTCGRLVSAWLWQPFADFAGASEVWLRHAARGQCSAAGAFHSARHRQRRYTAEKENSDVQVFFCPFARSRGAVRAGSEARGPAGAADQRRQAADAGPQGTEIDARIQPGKALAAGAFEPVVGWLGDQPRGRPPHRALGVEPAGNRDLRGHGGWRLRIRRQGQRPQAGGERRSPQGSRGRWHLSEKRR